MVKNTKDFDSSVTMFHFNYFEKKSYKNLLIAKIS